MKSLLIFSVLVIIVDSTINEQALKIVNALETKIGEEISKGSVEGVTAMFAEDFKSYECGGIVLDRAGIVAKMMKRQEEIPEPVYLKVAFVNDAQINYLLDEKFKTKETLSTNNTMKKIDGKWVAAYGDILKCK